MKLFRHVALCLGPLLKHFGDGLLHHLLIFVAVVIQGILRNTTPDQALILRVVNINYPGSLTFCSGVIPHTAAPLRACPTPDGILAFFYLRQSLCFTVPHTS